MADKEDWIDALLHDSRPVPVADDGFTHRLLAHLPERPRAHLTGSCRLAQQPSDWYSRYSFRDPQGT